MPLEGGHCLISRPVSRACYPLDSLAVGPLCGQFLSARCTALYESSNALVPVGSLQSLPDESAARSRPPTTTTLKSLSLRMRRGRGCDGMRVDVL